MSTTILDVREMVGAFRAIPSSLLVQPEHLGYDVPYAIALLPSVLAGMFFFRRDGILLYALCFLAGIVCLLALRLARLTLGLPAWIGYKANHPLIASLLVACFLSPRTPPWLGVGLVVLLVCLEMFVWPQLLRMMAHPALVVFGVLYVIQRQLPVGFVNPFDARRLDDPLSLWSKLHLSIDPVKLYVGNVPGPIGATSAGALLLGILYLWYARKISLGLVAGFLAGIAVTALLLRYDVAFQLSSGPALYVAGYIAADRRRITLAEPYMLLTGLAAGMITIALRAYGQGQEAAWEAFLLMGVLLTVVLRIQAILASRKIRTPVRSRAIQSGAVGPLPPQSPVSVERSVPVPAMVAAPTGAFPARRTSPTYPGAPAFDRGVSPDDMVRQMRIAAASRPREGGSARAILLGMSLVLLNPLGLALTWTSRSLTRHTRMVITAASAAWYLAVGGLLLAATHGVIKL